MLNHPIQEVCFPASAAAASQFRPLFEDPRARNVGDTLTITLNERTTANRSSNASAEKTAAADVTADLFVIIKHRRCG
jgi:flagellar basal body L-ring protein FlgH